MLKLPAQFQLDTGYISCNQGEGVKEILRGCGVKCDGEFYVSTWARPWYPSIWSNLLHVAVRVFWRIRLIFKSVGSESGRLPFITWWASSNQLQALIPWRLTSPEKEGILPTNSLWRWSAASALPWVSSLPAYPLLHVSLSHVESQFLKMNFFDFEYILPPLSGLQSSCRKVSW